jgi:uncharacterized membrane protein
MFQPKDPAQKIDLYLKQVRSGLHNLPEPHVMDILQELRSHILERAESSGSLSEPATDAALQSLGSPQEVASLYLAENFMARAESSRTPWTILRGVFHWATLSVKGVLVFMLCTIGYLFGAAFLIAALAKPFNPRAVGLWMVGPDSFSLRLGMTDSVAHGHELLGWFLIPIGCALGGGTIMLTTHFGLWCIRSFRRAASVPGVGHD